jgi:hypothetical protein
MQRHHYMKQQQSMLERTSLSGWKQEVVLPDVAQVDAARDLRRSGISARCNRCNNDWCVVRQGKKQAVVLLLAVYRSSGGTETYRLVTSASLLHSAPQAAADTAAMSHASSSQLLAQLQ